MASPPISTVVRRAKKKDLPTMAEINACVFAGDRDNPRSAERWMRCLFNAFPLYQYFVTEVNGIITGYIGWQFHGGFLRSAPVIELEQIGVIRDYQGQGLGPILVEKSIKEVIKWCRENNNRIESHIYLIVWGYAHNFNAMKVYFDQFSEGVMGMRRQHGDRTELMFRLKIPALLPIRRK